MVNKCSVTGCKSLYSKDNVKVRLHRFPLTNPETLPVWIAATGREIGWKPCKSSRLCGNHFQKSEYIIGHGKNVLKTTSVPTIEHRVDVMKYSKKKSQSFYTDIDHRNTLLKFKPMDSNDTNVEIVQVNYNDIYNLKYGHQNKGKNDDQKEYYEDESEELENEKCTIKNEHFSNTENSYDNQDDSSNDEAIKNEYEDFNYELKNDICNRENQCYMFTSSFKEGAEPLVLIPPEDKPSEESLDMDIDQPITNSNFKKMMAFKLKKEQRTTKDIYSLYFKALKKLKFQKEQQFKNSLNSDVKSFVNYIETQMRNLIPYNKVYLTAKQRIQKVLMQAQLKIAN